MNALLIPITIAAFFVLIMDKNVPSVSSIGAICVLFFSNLILMNIYSYFAKYLYKNFSNKKIEVVISGVSVLAAIIILNSLFWNNVFLKKTSSTDIFIILIIPIYGIFSMLAGYFLGYLIKKGQSVMKV